MNNLTEKFRHYRKVISSRPFLNKEALGGEIPFFIAAYDAKEELICQEEIKMLSKKLEADGIKVLEINLFDLSCQLLEEQLGMDKVFKIEQRRPKDKFLKALQSSLNIHEVLMPAIEEQIKAAKAQVYFITGIGLAYPIIRSHNVLNNLQNIAKDAPTVLFFPGIYNNKSLNLFALMKDDNHYRAYPLDSVSL